MASKPNGHGRAVVWPTAEQQINDLPGPAWGDEAEMGAHTYAPPPQNFPQLTQHEPERSGGSPIGFQAQRTTIPDAPHQPFAPWAVAAAAQEQQAQQIVQQHMAMPIAMPGRGPVQAYGTVEPPSEAGASHMFGLATLLVGTGAAVGFYYGGAFGGLAGSLFGGAAINAYRAFAYYRMGGGEEADREAKVSGTYALVAASLAGYLAYKHAKPRLATANPEGDEPSEPETANPEESEEKSCAIRPVGP